MASYTIPPVADESTITAASGQLAVKTGGISPTQLAAEAVTGVKVDDGIVKWASGTSASGTPGTVVASLTATAGNVFAALNILAYMPAVASSQLQVKVTYTDDTTTTMASTPANNATLIVGNNGGAVQADLTSPTTNEQAWDATLKIKKVEVLTAGTGTGTRWAALSAIEVNDGV